MSKIINCVLLLTTCLFYGQELVPITSNKYNWTSFITYDLAGHTISKGLNFFNGSGKTTQKQKWDVITGSIWNSEVRYDNFNRPALTTLSAPVNYSSFIYGSGFIMSNSLGIGLSDYDDASTLFNPPVTSPDFNSLGWYYSDQNNLDPYKDVTNYPYTRVIYSELNPGAPLAVLGGNKITIDGVSKWLQAYSFTMPLEMPLNTNEVFYKSLIGRKAIKTVYRDVNGEDVVKFMDNDGNNLGFARSGYKCGDEEENPDPHRDGCLKKAVFSQILDNGYVDIHIPKYCNGITITNDTSNNLIRVFDLITEQIIPPIDYATLPTGFYRIEDQENYYGKNNSPTNQITPISIQYQVNYYDLAFNEFDEAKRIIKSTQSIGLESTYEYDSFGRLLSALSPDHGEAAFKYRKDGKIRFSQNAEQAKARIFSYTNYDQLGRPVEAGIYKGSILFNGLDAIVDELDGLPTSGVRSEQIFTSYDIPDPDLLQVLRKCSLPDPDYTNFVPAGNIQPIVTCWKYTNKRKCMAPGTRGKTRIYCRGKLLWQTTDLWYD
jgi:YD repeat-containing protein